MHATSMSAAAASHEAAAARMRDAHAAAVESVRSQATTAITHYEATIAALKADLEAARVDGEASTAAACAGLAAELDARDAQVRWTMGRGERGDRRPSTRATRLLRAPFPRTRAGHAPRGGPARVRDAPRRHG